jgi:hypothetical protein
MSRRTQPHIFRRLLSRIKKRQEHEANHSRLSSAKLNKRGRKYTSSAHTLLQCGVQLSTGPTYKFWVEYHVKQWVETGHNVIRHTNFVQVSPLIPPLVSEMKQADRLTCWYEILLQLAYDLYTGCLFYHRSEHGSFITRNQSTAGT